MKSEEINCTYHVVFIRYILLKIILTPTGKVFDWQHSNNHEQSTNCRLDFRFVRTSDFNTLYYTAVHSKRKQNSIEANFKSWEQLIALPLNISQTSPYRKLNMKSLWTAQRVMHHLSTDEQAWSWWSLVWPEQLTLWCWLGSDNHQVDVDAIDTYCWQKIQQTKLKNIQALKTFTSSNN